MEIAGHSASRTANDKVLHTQFPETAHEVSGPFDSSMQADLKGRGVVVVSLALAAFAWFTALTQFFDEDIARYNVLSIPQFAGKLRALAGITNMVEFDTTMSPFDAACRKLDLGLPPDARVYLDDMLGATNLNRVTRYSYLAYSW